MISRSDSEQVAATLLTAIDPGIMLVQIGRYGMTHPRPSNPFDYTRGVLRFLLWEGSEIEAYISAAKELGASDDKSLATKVLKPLSAARREATHSTLAALSARK